MARCKIEVVNGTRASNNIYNVIYLPFCVSTLKLLITNNGEENTNLTIRPKNYIINNEKCCGLVDDDTGNVEIEISWGGGDELGSIVSLRPKESQNSYMFINHKSGAEVKIHNLTLNVESEIGNHAVTDEYNESDVRIKLYPLKARSPIIRQVQIGDDNESLSFEGTSVGLYYPRWFPELLNPLSSNIYYSLPFVPRFKIKLERKRSRSKKDIVRVNLGDHKEIASIVGDLRGASFCSNLFRLTENIFVIRLWFFWLNHKHFKDNRNLEIIQAENMRLFGVEVSPELPDSERYDIVVNATGKILTVGTDYHWKEYWYKLPNNELAMKGYIADWWRHRLFALFKNFIYGLRPVEYSSILNSLNKLTFGIAGYVDVRGTMAEELARSEQDSTALMIDHEDRVRGKSVFRSHVPYVENGFIIRDMISRRVDEHIPI